MCLPVFQLLQPPRPQSLVDGLSLAGARLIRTAGGWGLRGRKAGRGRDLRVSGAVYRVLRLEPCQRGAGVCGGGGGAKCLGGGRGQRGAGVGAVSGSDGSDHGGPVGKRPGPGRGLVEGSGRRLQSEVLFLKRL